MRNILAANPVLAGGCYLFAHPGDGFDMDDKKRQAKKDELLRMEIQQLRIKRAQERAKKNLGQHTSLADELLAERREAAKNEHGTRCTEGVWETTNRTL
jgi:hypothetical protein